MKLITLKIGSSQNPIFLNPNLVHNIFLYTDSDHELWISIRYKDNPSQSKNICLSDISEFEDLLLQLNKENNKFIRLGNYILNVDEILFSQKTFHNHGYYLRVSMTNSIKINIEEITEEDVEYSDNEPQFIDDYYRILENYNSNTL